MRESAKTSRRRFVGVVAYVTLVLLLAVAAWLVITSGGGRDALAEAVMPGSEDQRGLVETWDGGSSSVAHDEAAVDALTDPHTKDGEPEGSIADVVRSWVRGLSALTTLLGVLGWLVGLLIRSIGKRTSSY